MISLKGKKYKEIEIKEIKNIDESKINQLKDIVGKFTNK